MVISPYLVYSIGNMEALSTSVTKDAAKAAPFPVDSCLGIWYEKWLKSFDKNNRITNSKNILKIQARISQLLRERSQTESRKKWERLAYKLVLLFKAIPTVIVAKFLIIALEIQHAFTKRTLLTKNLNIHAA